MAAFWLGLFRSLAYDDIFKFWQWHIARLQVSEVRQSLATAQGAVETLQKELSFQREIYANERKQMQKALQNMNSAEREVLERFKIPYEQLVFGEKEEILGKGSFGVVKIATFFNEKVAVKMLIGDPNKDMSELIVNL